MSDAYNFEDISEINKDKKPPVEIEMQDMKEQEEAAIQQEQAEMQRQMQGASLLQGNRVVQAFKKGTIYQETNFFDGRVREAIHEKVKTSLGITQNDDIEYEAAVKAFDRKAIGERGDYLSSMRSLARSYPNVSLSKRQSELKMSNRLFAEMDQKKIAAQRERDPRKKQALKEEILRLKMRALICRAIAFAKDTAAMNDEIANIKIAANYELADSRKAFAYSLAQMGEDGNPLMTTEVKNMIENAEKIAEKNINNIALSRRRASGLERFRAVKAQREKQRRKERADEDNE